MTTNQTIDGVLVSRELAKRLAVPMLRTPEYLLDHRDALDDLRALLDAPAQCAHEWEPPTLSSMPDYCAKCSIDKPSAQPHGSTPDDDKSHPRFIAGYTAGLHDYKLGQPQGEPVAIERLSIQMLKGGLFRYDSDPEGPLVRYQDHAEQVKLYASQPAPVAHPPAGNDRVDGYLITIGSGTECPITHTANGRIFHLDRYTLVSPGAMAKWPAPVAGVMPERNTASKNLDLEQCGYVDGWNACLDELKRLNPSL